MKKNLLLAWLIGWQFVAWAGPDRFVAHEWGTFTSVQGADGVQLEWNPFVPLELPKFVYGQTRPPKLQAALHLGKADLIARQRMETPVIYFYSDTERTVDVTVSFPEGKVTEWYPAKAPNSRHTQWKNVRVLADAKALLPKDARGSHYYAARETPANVLQVGNEVEKFLFYRGVASFTAPLRVTIGGKQEDIIYLQNTGKEQLRHFYTIEIRNGLATFQYLDRIAPEEAREVKLTSAPKPMSLSDFQEQVGAAIRGVLEQEGLYPSEAASMVKTWRDSWFGEDGVRVLYVLPRTWTDRTLPLTIQPAPTEIARVMVGRAEVIFPSQEWKLLRHIVRYSDAAPDERPAIVDAVRQLGMGRFSDAATRRLLGRTPHVEFNAAAWALVDAVNLADRAKTLAAK